MWKMKQRQNQKKESSKLSIESQKYPENIIPKILNDLWQSLKSLKIFTMPDFLYIVTNCQILRGGEWDNCQKSLKTFKNFLKKLVENIKKLNNDC